MSNKITWDKIYKDFRRRHPNLSKDVINWRPYDYATILMQCKDGSKILYDYDTKKASFT